MSKRLLEACQADVRSARFFRRIEGDRREPRSIWGEHALLRAPKWEYINFRRLFLFVEESIDKEPHWGCVRAERRAALSPPMTQGDINNGRLICIIGVAPVTPAKFVIFRIRV